jgi:hypothetical protein
VQKKGQKSNPRKQKGPPSLCGSPAEQAGPETDHPRACQRAERLHTASRRGAPGDGLVELEGRRWCRCHRVEARGLVKGFPGWRTTGG